MLTNRIAPGDLLMLLERRRRGSMTSLRFHSSSAYSALASFRMGTEIGDYDRG